MSNIYLFDFIYLSYICIYTYIYYILLYSVFTYTSHETVRRDGSTRLLDARLPGTRRVSQLRHLLRGFGVSAETPELIYAY